MRYSRTKTLTINNYLERYYIDIDILMIIELEYNVHCISFNSSSRPLTFKIISFPEV